MIMIPVILIMLPADFFDHNEHSICLFTILSGIECWACGMTRACMHLIHLEPSIAWTFNKLSFISFPLLSFVWAKEGYNTYKRIWTY